MGPFKGLHGNRELVAFQFDVEISRLASNAAAGYFSPSLFTSGLEPIAHVDRISRTRYWSRAGLSAFLSISLMSFIVIPDSAIVGADAANTRNGLCKPRRALIDVRSDDTPQPPISGPQPRQSVARRPSLPNL